MSTTAPRIVALLMASGSCLVQSSAAQTPESYFRIAVVDEQTGRGVPLVELRTVNGIRHVTDSAGVIAFHEPGLMNQSVFFHVHSLGYQHAADGFGYRGVRLSPAGGGSTTVQLKRINIAERLYRITGGGIYRDSVLLGDDVPISEPVLNGEVFGSDSVQNAVYRGAVYWFWGDTNRPSYPLGNFHVPGAVSKLPAAGGLDPSVGVDLSYFVDEGGFAKPTCKMPGEGPTWIEGLTVVSAATGKERMFASYAKIKPPMTVYRRGLVEWNDEQSEFESRQTFAVDAPRYPQGHAFLHTDPSDDKTYVYYANPYPDLRVLAQPEAVLDLSRYEAWTCLSQSAGEGDVSVDRDENGRLRFAWRRDGVPLRKETTRKLVAAGKLEEDKATRRFTNVETGKAVEPHRGSVSWNAYRQRWIMIFTEIGGRSMLGEVWYAQAPRITGPWEQAQRIVTHDQYSFYNPKQHPILAGEDGRFVYFEGTYTHSFSGNSDPTPRYDYNQIMYRLDLSAPRLHGE